MTLAAVVVMLCCMGATAAAMPASQSNDLIARVLIRAHPSMFEEPTSESIEAPGCTTSCCVHVDIMQQIEIAELHNLPPPACFIV